MFSRWRRGMRGKAEYGPTTGAVAEEELVSGALELLVGERDDGQSS